MGIFYKKIGEAARWRLFKSAEAPAFFSLVRCVGGLGLIEGLATSAEERGLHGGGVLG